jgi:cytosine/adenosine deaminase-related metal-dependent hydrolase
MFGWPAPISFVNARVVTPGGEASSLRMRRTILSIGESPRAGDYVVDLGGRFVLPGLINAHDHLELNHYGPLRPRERYANAREWIDDLRPVIRQDPAIQAKSRIALGDRLFIGGIKNLLAGVTTVAHHNPLYLEFGLHYPVGLVERYGWAHSLGLEHGPAGAHGECGGVVADRCAATPSDQPFVVHAAEGVDECAAGELRELDRTGSLRPNTVLVHGLAIAPGEWTELFARGVSLVWCPASNLFLFGRTLCVPCVMDSPGGRQRMCLGTDSRLTGARDLLDELRVAAGAGAASDDLMAMVTSVAADVLRLDGAGQIRVGAAADLAVIPALEETAAKSLLRCRRSDVSLVVRRGTPMVGAPELSEAFSLRRIHTRRIEIDGRPRLMQAGLVRRIERCRIEEPGVRCDAS